MRMKKGMNGVDKIEKLSGRLEKASVLSSNKIEHFSLSV